MNAIDSQGPRLPKLLRFPLGLVPTRLNSAVLAQILNRLFKPELAEGELDFLDRRVMLIHVEDAGLSYRLTLRHRQLEAARDGTEDDLSIAGNVYEFLLLASRREDPDTLFFNRRLRLGGSTELGLFVKNFLDGLELDDRLGPIKKVLDGATGMMDRLTKR